MDHVAVPMNREHVAMFHYLLCQQAHCLSSGDAATDWSELPGTPIHCIRNRSQTPISFHD